MNKTPTAIIDAEPTKLFVSVPETEIVNESLDATSYIWDLGDGTGQHTFFEPGLWTFPVYHQDQYLIKLIAISDEGCMDSTLLRIEMDNSPIIYVPNSFSPDGDQHNNEFKAELGAPVSEFRMRVYNRWGELVYESVDPEYGWDGSYKGQMAQDGTYIWEVLIRTTLDADAYILRGHVNLLR